MSRRASRDEPQAGVPEDVAPAPQPAPVSPVVDTQPPVVTETETRAPSGTEPQSGTEPRTAKGTDPGTRAVLEASRPLPEAPAVDRPRAPRRPRVVRRVLVGVIAAAVLGIAGAAGILAAPFAASLYAEFGYHPAEDAQAWAARPLVFAAAASCAACHDEQRVDLAGSEHRAVSCASCHGALAAHVEDETNPALLNPPPEAADCLACHARSLGRPALMAQVVPATHFASGVCVTCHDAHNTTASDPPDIGHAIAGLPACITCHGAKGNGIKAWPDDHVDAPDTTCLTCHTPATVTRTDP